MGNALSRPKREFQYQLQVKERDRPILELSTYDTVGGKPQTITIETQGSLEIIDPKRDDCYSWFHATNPLEA